MSPRSHIESGCAGATMGTAVVWAALAALAVPATALEIISVSPARHALAASRDASIRVEFDRSLLESSVTPESLWAFGRWSGSADGAVGFSNGGRTVTLTPDRRFSAGEQVMVILSHDLEGTDGSHLRSSGFSYQFWIHSRGTGFNFTENDRFSTRTVPEVTSRAYGGFGADLNGDGFLDLTIVNEDTDDLRVFLNRADRSGTFTNFLEPTAVAGNVPSPSETTDFDRDGLVDVVVANTQDQTVSILLGNGDGTFAAAHNVFVGGEPRGIAVLDIDGDGDVDIAATSFELGRVSLLENDGTGNFTEGPVFAIDGARALAAGDMNDDGVLDLVVGALTPQQIHVWTGDGDGAFSFAEARSSGGEVWMLVLGDVDGNGTEDVASANSDSNNGAILLGDGTGALAEPRLMPTDALPLATDLADLDGDGDLDWVTASFFGNWMLFENDGSGAFSFNRSFPAPQAASCSLAMDFDNDGVLDLALIDELEDEVILMTNRALVFASDFEVGTTAQWSRTRGSVAVVSPGLRGSHNALEVSVDGTEARSYVESRHPANESSFRVEFDLNVNRVDLAGGSVEILRLAGGKPRAILRLEESNGRYRVRLVARDRGSLREIGSTRVPAGKKVRVGVEWSEASGPGFVDGRAALAKKGRIRALATNLANRGQGIKKVRLGLPLGSAGVAGNVEAAGFLVDNYRSTR